VTRREFQPKKMECCANLSGDDFLLYHALIREANQGSGPMWKSCTARAPARGVSLLALKVLKNERERACRRTPPTA
jgi:hypothetical protein